jgi:threonine dehydratase
MTQLLGRADVEEARQTLAPFLAPTPLRRAFSVPGGQAWLKLECWQPTGSFKVRGALNVISALGSAERRRGVVAASAGNHALGVAFAIQALGGEVPATVFVPATAPRAKVDKLRTFPVTVVEGGATYDEAAARAAEHARTTGAFTVHAYDDPRTAAGQGTIGLEILEQNPRIGTVVVPVGGGGLIAGSRPRSRPSAPTCASWPCSPEASPALRDSSRRASPSSTIPRGRRSRTAWPAGSGSWSTRTGISWTRGRERHGARDRRRDRRAGHARPGGGGRLGRGGRAALRSGRCASTTGGRPRS